MSTMDSLIQQCGGHYERALSKVESVNQIDGNWDSNTDTYDISFRYDDKLSLLLVLDQDDKPFVRLILPNFYSLDNAREKRGADDAISRANQKCKGVKLFLDDDRGNTTAAVEFLDPYVNVDGDVYDHPGMPAAILQRYIGMVLSAASFYAQKLS